MEHFGTIVNISTKVCSSPAYVPELIQKKKTSCQWWNVAIGEVIISTLDDPEKGGFYICIGLAVKQKMGNDSTSEKQS